MMSITRTPVSVGRALQGANVLKINDGEFAGKDKMTMGREKSDFHAKNKSNKIGGYIVTLTDVSSRSRYCLKIIFFYSLRPPPRVTGCRAAKRSLAVPGRKVAACAAQWPFLFPVEQWRITVLKLLADQINPVPNLPKMQLGMTMNGLCGRKGGRKSSF